MTDPLSLLVLVIVACPLVTAMLVLLPHHGIREGVCQGGAVITTGAVAVLVVNRLTQPQVTVLGGWGYVDARACVFLVVAGLVGLGSVLASPAYLSQLRDDDSFFVAQHAEPWYYCALFVFWGILLSIPIAANLGLAWILVEASTVVSALLVVYSGKVSALEAGWKYLILTSAGLSIALVGIVVLYVGARGGDSVTKLDWAWLTVHVGGIPHTLALLSLVLITVGFAAKVGWAPVHQWLPDAHSEAPPPVSALLSAALLPAVLLIVWRTGDALAPAAGVAAVHRLFLGFGLVSLAVAAPFLWRPQPWKRLLAYSSLEHVGVMALGIGFGTPMAVVGVALHVVGHAQAKCLGFWVAAPLLAHQPAVSRHPLRGLGRTSPNLSAAVAVCLWSLAGLPPAPLFFSELLILVGGIAASQVVVAGLAAVLLALNFLGLLHALLEGLLGRARHSISISPRLRRFTTGSVVMIGSGLVLLSGSVLVLPGSIIAARLVASGP